MPVHCTFSGVGVTEYNDTGLANLSGVGLAQHTLLALKSINERSTILFNTKCDTGLHSMPAVINCFMANFGPNFEWYRWIIVNWSMVFPIGSHLLVMPMRHI